MGSYAPTADSHPVSRNVWPILCAVIYHRRRPLPNIGKALRQFGQHQIRVPRSLWSRSSHRYAYLALTANLVTWHFDLDLLSSWRPKDFLLFFWHQGLLRTKYAMPTSLVITTCTDVSCTHHFLTATWKMVGVVELLLLEIS